MATSWAGAGTTVAGDPECGAIGAAAGAFAAGMTTAGRLGVSKKSTIAMPTAAPMPAAPSTIAANAPPVRILIADSWARGSVSRNTSSSSAAGSPSGLSDQARAVGSSEPGV